MSKATVTRLFIASAIAFTAGAVVVVTAIWAALGNGVFVIAGPDIVGIQGGPPAWAMLGLGLVGSLTAMGALVGGLVAWIGALLNTAQLESKTWFVVLLVLGILNFGVIAMLAYVAAGPDGTAPVAPSATPLPA